MKKEYLSLKYPVLVDWSLEKRNLLLLKENVSKVLLVPDFISHAFFCFPYRTRYSCCAVLGLPICRFSRRFYRVAFCHASTQKHRPKLKNMVHKERMISHALLQTCPSFLVYQNSAIYRHWMAVPLFLSLWNCKSFHKNCTQRLYNTFHGSMQYFYVYLSCMLFVVSRKSSVEGKIVFPYFSSQFSAVKLSIVSSEGSKTESGNRTTIVCPWLEFFKNPWWSSAAQCVPDTSQE